MPGETPGSFRVRTRRGWSQHITVGAGTGGLLAGVLVIAGCGGGPATQGPSARVTIVSGNLTFSSAAGGERRADGPAPRAASDRAAGDRAASDGRPVIGLVTAGPGTLSSQA